MKLKQKLCEPFGGLKKETANELEKIADEYAIDFMKWYFDLTDINTTFLPEEELLEIFKKEKGL